MSIGGITCTVADIRLIFSVALSEGDIDLAKRIKEAEKLPDHLTISPVDREFYS